MALVAIVGGGPAMAQDVNLRVEEVTFDEFAAAIQPMPINGQYAFRTTINLGIFGRHTITWCDSAYSGSVDGLKFDIDTTDIEIEGDVSLSWCGFRFGAPGPELSAIGDVTYNTADSTIRFSFTSATVQPSITAFGRVIHLPVSINIAPTFNIPPLHFGSTVMFFSTVDGAYYAHMTPTSVTVRKRNGYIELTSNVVMQ